jgi:endonuclease/exonuclease/phosphatase family metal-dependent hydrolase
MLARVLGEIAPDVAVLQEATDPAVVQTIADATGSRVVLQAPGRSVAVLSRLDWHAADWRFVAAGRAVADVELAGGVRLLGAHLTAGLSRRGERRREAEARALLAAMGPGSTAPTILAGDLNAIAPGDRPVVAALPTWIRVLLRVDGGIGTTAMRSLLAAGYVDAFRTLHPDDPGLTMPAMAPSVRLDYVLVSPDLAAAVVACRVGGPDATELAAASDHLPLVAELELPG